MGFFGKRNEQYIEYEEEAEEYQEEQITDDDEFDSRLTDYDIYVMTFREKVIYMILAAAVIFSVGMIFYQRAWIAAIPCIAAIWFPKLRTKQIIKKRKQMLNMQFKDLLYALSSSMEAGRSLEMAFRDALRDLAVLYPDDKTYIIEETTFIVRSIENNVTVEEAVSQFAARAHIEDIKSFADVIRICKRSGGNLIDVIRSTSRMIADKIDTKNEIETVITAKKFESRILCCTPIVMVAILSYSSPEYMQPVFEGILGALVMTIAVIMFIAAFFIGEKIMDIEV